MDDSGTCVTKDLCPCFNKYDPLKGRIKPGETISLNCANWCVQKFNSPMFDLLS